MKKIFDPGQNVVANCDHLDDILEVIHQDPLFVEKGDRFIVQKHASTDWILLRAIDEVKYPEPVIISSGEFFDAE